MNEARTNAWRDYIEDCNAAGIAYRDACGHAFKAGYDSRDAEVEGLEDCIREFERATEEVVQEYHLKSCDCSEPLAEAVNRLEAALSSGTQEVEDDR